jgi:superfamily I DNA/RNA helicase
MVKPGNELLIIETANDLKELVEKSVKSQTEFHPVFEAIIQNILDIVSAEGELETWEQKDILSLFDKVNKARLQPIEQLTKLVTAVQSLYETSALQDRMNELADVVNELTNKDKVNDEVEEAEIIDIDEIIEE